MRKGWPFVGCNRALVSTMTPELLQLQCVFDCLNKLLIFMLLHCSMTVWASGLRHWLQAPVRKGVGSNPTAVKSASAELDSLRESFRGKPAAPMGSMQRSFFAENRRILDRSRTRSQYLPRRQYRSLHTKLPCWVCCPWQRAMPAQHSRISEQAQHKASTTKNHETRTRPT